MWRIPDGKFILDRYFGYFGENQHSRADQIDGLQGHHRAKWSHFSEQEVSALKGKADLVTQVAAKYGLEQAQAQREVDAVLKGRQIGAGA